MKRLTFMIVSVLVFFDYADAACHHYSIWKNPWPQKCPARIAQKEVVQELLPGPPDPPPDMPLPSLEGMVFQPDCNDDWCQRLKGIGMLRERYGTN